MGQNPHVKKMKVERVCQNCKKTFLTTPRQVRIGFGNFCSRSCRNKFTCTGKLLTQEHRNKLHEVSAKRGREENRRISLKSWRDNDHKEEMIKAILKGLIKRPTSLEKEMIDIIKRNDLPYKYTGNGSFLIGYKNPDFININGEKKLIEVGNTYHHDENYAKERSAHFAKYGWRSYIFIENKLNEANILKTIKYD